MKKILNILLKKEVFQKEVFQPPIWIMRQAGRYLPEYREIRAKTNNFLDLCYNPKLASEITMQPIKRFGFDAAIIFSDILVIPHALGIDVKFVKNEGPILQKTSNKNDLKNLKIEKIESFLQPVFENIALTKSKLDKDKALIGFSGSPFTLACYMIEGGSSKNFDLVKKTALQNEDFFFELIEILTESVEKYLIAQINSGVEIIKLFDSWAGILPEKDFQKWVINPTKKIVKNIKEKFPNIAVICFPRGCGTLYENFAKQINFDCLAIDQNISKEFVKKNLQEKNNIIVQGNLDNQLLAYGSKAEIEKEVREILQIFGEKPFIFNLGHGILPETPIENVEFMLKIVRGES